ncbi:MAG: c-type cytochrome [Acidobacteriota bacterium]|nr:c-type cytochrome [Acidobacteriota bacterium]
MVGKRISYGIVGVVFAALLSLMITGRLTTAASGKRRQVSITASQTRPSLDESYAPNSVSPQAGPEETVEQTRKNIKVLKGLPESRLFPVMNFVGDSLGVKCVFCHVMSADNHWVWESDEKPTKLIARRMMQMVMDLNRTNGPDFTQGAVTCYTCHRGQPSPVNLPPMPIVGSAHEPGGQFLESAVAEIPHPTPDQILERYVIAVGGKAQISNVRTMLIRATVERTQGRTGPIEIIIRRPDSYHLTATIPQQGTFIQAYSGSSGWVIGPGVQRQLSAADINAVRRQAESFDLLKIHEPFPRMSFAGVEQIAGRKAYVLESILNPGTKQKLYFDTETGLLVRKVMLTDTVLLPIPEQFDFEDYRDVNGLKIPFMIRYSAVDSYDSVTRKLSEIKLNVPVEDSIFKMPPA